ncbi:metallophosphoesterase family protein [Sphingomonas swuensis]|uniref:metallophosphoesterase family protein n=1 Tax=Sphingomonas swuensis TaxID=977800 RepID=UPI0031D2EEFC
MFRVVQVGDIHYSDSENFQSPVDNKDPGFPAALRESIGTAPLQAVFRSLSHVLETGGIDFVTFMGDFTTRGDSTALNECARYIRGLFAETWPGEGPDCKLIIGNHDIDRRLDPDSDDRFERINAVLTGAGFKAASILAPCESVIPSDDAAEVRVFGINSCRGCGQLRLLGSILEKHAGPAIRKLLVEGGSGAELDELYEQIDTPAIDEHTIALLANSLSHVGETVMPVICAHHNLLPQAMPRIAPYSELINGGAIRAALLNLNRPLLYLHGHLHTSPIEVVRVPEHTRSAIISISAPLLREGFNVIEIAFNQEAVPLGCRVIAHRLDGSQCRIASSNIIPAWTAAEGLRLTTFRARELMKVLEPDAVVPRSDLLARLSWPEMVLDDALTELRWLGAVEIPNHDRPAIHWRVTRSI